MINDKDIAKLWVRLTAAFGYRFTETYGHRDTGVWLEVLRDFTAKDLQAGFRRMLRYQRHLTTQSLTKTGKPPDIWPPNALEFRQYCEQARKHCGLPTPGEAFIEAKSNSYVSNPHWSHGVIQAAMNCVYREKSKRVDDFLHDEDYTAFAKYYVALRDAWLNSDESVEREKMPLSENAKKIALSAFPATANQVVKTDKE